jgi:hypothetical protein
MRRRLNPGGMLVLTALNRFHALHFVDFIFFSS